MCAPPATGSAGGPGSVWRSPSPTSGWRRHVVSDRYADRHPERRDHRPAHRPRCARYGPPLLAPAEWGALARAGGALHWVVLNVADGPGVRPDPHCLQAAGGLRNAGVRVLGHLDLVHGVRALAEVLSDARRHLDWYRVDGFLLDRCPAGRAELPEVRRTVDALRTLREAPHIVLGQGIHPHPGYADHADQLVTFSGPWTDYRWSQVAEWTADHPPERFCHLVHGTPRAISTRPCASPAGRARPRSGSPTGATAAVWTTHGRPCPATGTKSSRGSERVSRNEEGRGSVTGRTTVVIDRPTESPCRCHPWSSQPLSSP